MSAPIHDPNRRDKLGTIANPMDDMDYEVALERQLMIAGKHITLNLRLIPDRWTLEMTAVDNWLDHFCHQDWSLLEELAGALIDDINNQVVPRWTRITVSGSLIKDANPYSVTMSDRQPQWQGKAP